MAGNRTIGVAVDFSNCSKVALRWAVDNLVREGDDLILLNIQKQAFYEGGEMQLWETTGSHVWKESGLANIMTYLKPVSSLNFIEEFFQNLSNDQKSFGAILLWNIWRNRNEIVHGGYAKAVSALIEQAQIYFESLVSSNQNLNITSTRSLSRWISPPPNVVKINVDAAIFPATSNMGIGVVGRNDEGRILTACTIQEPKLQDVATMEARAVLEGLTIASREGYSDIIIESDCQVVVDAINSSAECLRSFGTLVEEIKIKRQGFNSSKICHIYREANQVAHALAKCSSPYIGYIYWRDNLPDGINYFVVNDQVVAI